MDAMDIILTNFISQTRADPALAQDLLEATNWDMDAAILAFESLQDTRAVEPPEYQYDPSKCYLSHEYQYDPSKRSKYQYDPGKHCSLISVS